MGSRRSWLCCLLLREEDIHDMNVNLGWAFWWAGVICLIFAFVFLQSSDVAFNHMAKFFTIGNLFCNVLALFSWIVID
jgi:hypothetical protein